MRVPETEESCRLTLSAIPDCRFFWSPVYGLLAISWSSVTRGWHGDYILKGRGGLVTRQHWLLNRRCVGSVFPPGLENRKQFPACWGSFSTCHFQNAPSSSCCNRRRSELRQEGKPRWPFLDLIVTNHLDSESFCGDQSKHAERRMFRMFRIKQKDGSLFWPRRQWKCI